MLENKIMDIMNSIEYGFLDENNENIINIKITIAQNQKEFKYEPHMHFL